ncbi:hypothetical protein QJS10_CPA08g00269 [Acorus calamus]|uniref:Uncharacterized protein n=1 Tax=Acorus calamus TaxID=4465 RepID=A0AAV9ECY5_ACOCL|nr:hypothetical protein QJS10_CPA08g00269 [Acorus calamus]
MVNMKLKMKMMERMFYLGKIFQDKPQDDSEEDDVEVQGDVGEEENTEEMAGHEGEHMHEEMVLSGTD